MVRGYTMVDDNSLSGEGEIPKVGDNGADFSNMRGSMGGEERSFAEEGL